MNLYYLISRKNMPETSYTRIASSEEGLTELKLGDWNVETPVMSVKKVGESYTVCKLIRLPGTNKFCAYSTSDSDAAGLASVIEASMHEKRGPIVIVAEEHLQVVLDAAEKLKLEPFDFGDSKLF